MSIRNLLPQRAGTASLAALALLGSLGFASTASAEWTKGQIARHERYLACKVNLQRDPPCSHTWTRQCARRCNALFW